MADLKYNSGKAAIFGDTTYGAIDLLADELRVALVTSTYTPDIDANHTYSDLTNEVANGNGYTTGGATLGTKTVTIDDTNDKGVFDAANTTWSASSITARAAVIYKYNATATLATLIAYVDFGSDQTSASGDFTITWDANGILTLS